MSIFKSKKSDEQNTSLYENSKESFARIQNLINLQSNKKNAVKYLINIIVEYLNYKEAIEAISDDPEKIINNSLIYEIYRRLKLDYLKENCKSYDNPKTIEINECPILLNPWNGGRVLSNMFTINDENIFSGIQHKLNVVNQIIIPIGIIVCGGGNHSQFAARFKNKGETIITHELDISNLYADLKFDGEEFVYKDTQKIDLSSFPPIIKFYAGVLFELGRYFI